MRLVIIAVCLLGAAIYGFNLVASRWDRHGENVTKIADDVKQTIGSEVTRVPVPDLAAASEAAATTLKKSGLLAVGQSVEDSVEVPTLEIKEQEVSEKVYVDYEYKNRKAPAQDELSRLFPRDVLVVDASTNRVSVVTEDTTGRTAGILASLDVPMEVVRVEAILALVSLTKGEKFGFDWAWSTSGLSGVETGFAGVFNDDGLSTSLSGGGFRVVLDALTESGKLVVLSRPSIATVYGEKGNINSGREVAVPTRSSVGNTNEVRVTVDYREVGLGLEVTPQKIDDRVLLKVVQRNQDISGVRLIDGNEIPEFTTQSVDSTLLLVPGAWAAIGGAVVVNGSDVKEKAPLFSEIPLLGRLFQVADESTSRIELGVFIRVVPLDYVEVDFPVTEARVLSDAQWLPDAEGVLAGELFPEMELEPEPEQYGKQAPQPEKPKWRGFRSPRQSGKKRRHKF